MINRNKQTIDLLPEGEFLIIREPSFAYAYPAEINLSGKQYFKHMGIIYLPEKPEKLNVNQIVELGKLRARYFDSIVDRNYVKEIYSFTYKLISRNLTKFQKKSGIKMLDYGSGTGTFVDCVRFGGIDGEFPIKFYGVDLTKYKEEKKGLYDSYSNISYDKMILPYMKNYFDVEVALYVLHYDIPEQHLIELHDKLCVNGLFIFNLYRPTDEFRSMILTKINNAGFNWTTTIFESDLEYNGAKHAPVEFYLCVKTI